MFSPKMVNLTFPTVHLGRYCLLLVSESMTETNGQPFRGSDQIEAPNWLTISLIHDWLTDPASP